MYCTDHMFRLMSDFVVEGDVTYQIKLKLCPRVKMIPTDPRPTSDILVLAH